MQNDNFYGNQTSTTSTKEGQFTKSLEKQTAKIPSSYFLAAAGGAVAISLLMAVSNKRKDWANFVGNWVPSILLLGIYNKIVKTQGSDSSDPGFQIH